MKKLKLIFAQFPTFAMMQEMEAKKKPKEHYLIRRKNKLLKLLNCARSDKEDHKVIQAQRLIKDMEKVLSNNGKLLYAHIEQKEVIN